MAGSFLLVWGFSPRVQKLEFQPPALGPKTWGVFPQTKTTVAEAWGNDFEARGLNPQVWDPRSHIWGFVGEDWGFIPQAWGNDPQVSPRFS